MQDKDNTYEIDKTKPLEDGIKRFPLLYIEGNAAVGKTTAVEKLLKKYPNVEGIRVDFSKKTWDIASFCKKVSLNFDGKKEKWFVLEQVPEDIENQIADFLVDFIETMTNKERFIWVSRRKPPSLLLELFWKGQLEIIPMEKLLFSLEDIRMLIKSKKSSWNPEEFYKKTSGWPGCVMALLRLAENRNEKKLEELLQSYEIKNYIKTRILNNLTEQEWKVMAYAAGCPWLNEAFLAHFCPTADAEDILENLQRKGMLQFDVGKHRWKLSSLFQNYISKHCPELGKENRWYEEQGYLAEAFFCVKQAGDEAVYKEMMLKYWNQIYQLELFTEDVLKWKGKTPQECYLRGVYYYRTQQFEKLRKEIGILQKITDQEWNTKEVLINLSYLDPQITCAEWLELVEQEYEDGHKFQLYQMLGSSVSYLCGVRDLSGLFACTTKEEKRQARLWKMAFGEKEWKCYRLARMDYYLEIQQKDSIPEKDWYFLEKIDVQQDSWQIHVAKLYLICKSQKMQPDEIQTDKIEALESVLNQEESFVCRKLTEAIISIHSPWYGAREKMSKWLRYGSCDDALTVNEDNYMALCCRTKGYLRLNQFDRAEKL